MKGDIIASIALFQSLYNNKQDIYSVLAQFVKATINQKNLWNFNITTLKFQLKECFEIDVYESVLKTVIHSRLKDIVKNSNGEYQATPSQTELQNFENQKSEQIQKYQFVSDALISYYRATTSQNITDSDIINSFTKFLLSDSNQDTDHIFSKFILSKENDKHFISCLNYIKEGFIIISGLNDISDSTDLNSIGSWSNKLIIYLDTEELFSAYGYNGDLYQQILSDFLSLVKDANKRTKLIELRYLDETKNTVDGYFNWVMRVIDKKERPDGKTAMNTILSKCRESSDVLVEQGQFYAFLKSHEIAYDERSSYVEDMSGNLQTENNLDILKNGFASSSLTVKDDEILKYLRIFSIINHKRKLQNNSNFEKCQCVLLTENSIPRYISRHESIRKKSDFTFSTTMDYAISKLWFRLHKGIIGKQTFASLNVINKVRIVMTSLLHQSVLQKYEELDKKEYSKDERISIYNTIRAYEIHPEEVNNDNITEIIDFIEIKDIEILRREKATLQEKAKQGEVDAKKLTELKKRIRTEYKPKIKRALYWKVSRLNLICLLICIGLGYLIFLTFSPQDTLLAILSFLIGCLILPALNLYPKYKKKVKQYKNHIIQKQGKILIQKYRQKGLY